MACKFTLSLENSCINFKTKFLFFFFLFFLKSSNEISRSHNSIFLINQIFINYDLIILLFIYIFQCFVNWSGFSESGFTHGFLEKLDHHDDISHAC